jgi:hypothetical protein
MNDETLRTEIVGLIDNFDTQQLTDLAYLMHEQVISSTASMLRSATEYNQQIERAICKHCENPISRAPEGSWRHGAFGSRGCRAASFDRDGTWDDSLDRKRYASPPSGRDRK